MKNSDFALLLAAVWLAPHSPDILNVIAGGLYILVSLYYKYYGD